MVDFSYFSCSTSCCKKIALHGMHCCIACHKSTAAKFGERWEIWAGPKAPDRPLTTVLLAVAGCCCRLVLRMPFSLQICMRTDSQFLIHQQRGCIDICSTDSRHGRSADAVLLGAPVCRCGLAMGPTRLSCRHLGGETHTLHVHVHAVVGSKLAVASGSAAQASCACGVWRRALHAMVQKCHHSSEGIRFCMRNIIYHTAGGHMCVSSLSASSGLHVRCCWRCCCERGSSLCSTLADCCLQGTAIMADRTLFFRDII